MAWTNADYESESTDSARLTKARLFKAELMGRINANLSSEGKQRENEPLVSLLRIVVDDIARYESRLGVVDSDAAVVTSGFTQGRPV